MFGEDAYPTLEEKAAALLHSLVRNHAFVDGNHEYPVNESVEPEPVIAGFGEFQRMPLSAEAYGSQNAEAVKVLSEAGYT